MNSQNLKLCLPALPLRLFFCGKGINKCAYGICNYCSVKLQLLIEFVHWRNALVVVLSLKSSQRRQQKHVPCSFAHFRVPWIQVINSVYILDWLLCSYIFSKCVCAYQTKSSFSPSSKIKVQNFTQWVKCNSFKKSTKNWKLQWPLKTSKDLQRPPKTSKDLQRPPMTFNTLQWPPKTSNDLQRRPHP